MRNLLVFNNPPEKWEHYLPIGNGRLGCMVKAHPCNEVIQLNEEGIWSGGPQNRLNPDSKKNLSKIRTLIKEGKVLEAQKYCFESLSGMGFNDRVYQTAGEFKIDFFSKKDSGLKHGWPLAHSFSPKCLSFYKGTLDLDKACATVSYKNEDGVNFTRRTWISAPDDILFMHVSSDSPGSINFSGYFDRGIWSDQVYADDGFIFLEDSHGIPFCEGAGMVCRRGESGTRGFCLYGNACDEVLFFIDIKTWKYSEKARDKKAYEKLIRKNTWAAECKNHLRKIRREINASCGVNESSGGVNNISRSVEHSSGAQDIIFRAADYYFNNHLKEYESYWKTFSLKIGVDDEEKKSSARGNNNQKKENIITTPELLKAACKSNTSLVNLYAAFSRYLMIAGSRKPGVLPLTLQGLWNPYMDPPWGSKYTININAQMNYWPSNISGLSECELPLFNLLERSFERGKIAAKKLYGSRGFVLHHNTDFWGDAGVQDAWIPSSYWVLGAAWLCTHIYEHFEYTNDKSFLARYYYLMHEAALFFVDYLIPSSDASSLADDGKPYLVISPTLSPENSYITKTGETGAVCEGSQMDNMILEHLFKSVLSAEKILGENACSHKGKKYPHSDFDSFEFVLSHLKKPSLNKDGSLMEWNQEVEEVEPGHRHVSHLYGLFPGHTITKEETPELAKACVKTLEKRLKNGGGHTGWSQAWIINFWAQLGMGNKALDSIVNLFKNSTLPNLLDNHPPFQIDGNFGALAGIIRLLVQSDVKNDGTISVKLLPSLPTEASWQSGKIKGAGIKGGYTLDFEWKNGKVTTYTLHPGQNAVEKTRVKVLENN